MVLAYLDPGAGSLMIQAIVAGAIAAPFFLRTQIRSLLDRLWNRTSADPESVTTDRSSR